MSEKQAPIDRTTTRRQRRAAARASHGTVPTSATSGKRPSGVRSPMALISIGAVLVGVVVIGFALFSSGAFTEAGTVKEPLNPIPDKALWDGRALGKADAPVTLEVYEDFQCPACELFSTNTQQQLVKDYVASGKIRLVYKDMLIIDRGDETGESHRAAVAARCAGDQGLFWPYHEYLFANQKGENEGHFSDAFLLSIAKKVGVDADAWSACVKTPEPLAAAKAETDEGNERGVSGTPTVFVGSDNVGFPAYLDLKAKIDAALAAAGQ